MKAKSMLFRSRLCLLFLLLISACPAATGRIIYVEDNDTGVNNGSTRVLLTKLYLIIYILIVIRPLFSTVIHIVTDISS